MARDVLDVQLDRDLGAAVIAYTTALSLSDWECACCRVASPRPTVFSRAQLQSTARSLRLFDGISFATWDLAIWRAVDEGLLYIAPGHMLTTERP